MSYKVKYTSKGKRDLKKLPLDVAQSIILSIHDIKNDPIFFKKAKSTKNWASKSVLGERVWLNRDKIEIPKHHKTLPKILNGISSVGMILSIWGIVVLS